MQVQVAKLVVVQKGVKRCCIAQGSPERAGKAKNAPSQREDSPSYAEMFPEHEAKS